MSQAELARQSGVSRITLNRWEANTQQPRLTELKTVLHVLRATKEQCQRAKSLLHTPSGRIQQRVSNLRLGEEKGIGGRPHGGSLLLALRLRKGLPQEDTARMIGVTTRTLRHWERAETWPSSEQLHTLCYVLGAYQQEILALTMPEARFELGCQRSQPTLDEIEDRNDVLHRYDSDQSTEALKDLGFFALQSQAWPLASHSEAGRHVLGRIYSHHAHYYSSYERWGEGALQANRALDLLSTQRHPDQAMTQAAIAAARCMIYQGSQPAPERGLEILRPWIDMVPWLEFQSWLLSDIAKYEMLRGNASYSLEMVTRARETALNSNSTYDLYMRELDEAQVLLQAGKAAQTLNILEQERFNLQPDHIVDFRLLEAEASLMLHDTNRAAECLHQAQQLIEQWSLPHLQSRVQRVVDQF